MRTRAIPLRLWSTNQEDPMRTSLLALSILGACATPTDAISFEDLLEEEASPGKADAYGSEKRVDLYEAGEGVRQLARSIGAVVNPDQIKNISSTEVTIAPFKFHTDTLAEVADDMGYPLCPDEPFRDQPSRARGTAFLIAPDVVATARHVAVKKSCADTRIVFDFGYREEPSERPHGLRLVTNQPRDNVFGCRAMVFPPGDLDVALIQLDRPASGRFALSLVDEPTPPAVGAPVLMIGHPTGLPSKFAPPGRVIHKEEPDLDVGFYTNLGAFKGNSGSPVASTRGIEGVLVRGDRDWQWTTLDGAT